MRPFSFKASFITLSLATLLAACSANADSNNQTSNDHQTAKTTQPAQLLNTTNDPATQQVLDNVRNNLKKSGIDVNILSVKATPMDNIYWVSASDMAPFFTDTQGKHIIQGQIAQVGDAQPVDISTELLQEVAKDKLAAEPTENMVVYPAKGDTKAVIYAFTDATCPYCQRLHQDVPDLNTAGVEVRYLAWPRNPHALTIMQSVWCASDRKAAFDNAKNGGHIPPATCDSNVVNRHTDLGFSLGVQGTPAVFDEQGRQLGGYLPTKQLLSALGI